MEKLAWTGLQPDLTIVAWGKATHLSAAEALANMETLVRELRLEGYFVADDMLPLDE